MTKPDSSKATVMVIGAPIGPSDIPGLCGRAERLMESGVATVICDVAAFEEVDMVVVDALARLQLIMTRDGGELRLSHVSPALRDLLEWSGLDDAFGQIPRIRHGGRRWGTVP
ncbi:MAG: STAS domain-containing protein [Acidimicrobiia bacterium]|nr:STAS domain-containing protein [Acidimicrobiia bacterium]